MHPEHENHLSVHSSDVGADRLTREGRVIAHTAVQVIVDRELVALLI